jgi:sulfoxide reductase heme-binding subunit YedZ
VTAALATNSRALWYLTRGFGLVALILLTVTMALGLAQAVRFARPGWPRFVVSALHRNASLLAIAVLVVHITTAVLDSFAPITVIDVFIPFVSKYRPVWLGLGALAIDILLALVVTSLVRERLGQRAWRAVHWAAYACWPLAVVHGLGTGTDTKVGWVLLINAACVVAVLAALWWRLARGWSSATAGRRGAALFASIALPVAIAAWTVSGPLHAGWARRAGTPPALTAGGSSTGVTSSSVPSGTASSVPSGTATPALAVPLTATFTGTQTESGPDANGLMTITINGSFGGSGRLQVALSGQPAAGGGVDLSGGQVTVGTSSNPGQYRGQVTGLSGSQISASLSDAGGATFPATLTLRIGAGDSLSGTIAVSR